METHNPKVVKTERRFEMHYSLLVIGDGVECTLAEFDENLEVDEYDAGPVTEEEKEMFVEHYSNGKETNFSKLYSKYGEGWNNWCWRKNSSGKWHKYYTSNPKGKYDWCCIGGRFEGQLILKDKKEGLKGTPGIQSLRKGYTAPPDSCVDSAYKGDIDWNLMNPRFHTFAVLNDDGWTECSMFTDGSLDAEKWVKAFYDRFIKDLPDDTLLTVVDYHS